jgi:hypothetical protein
MKGEQIKTTKDGAKSFDNEIRDYLTTGQMVFYVKNSGHLSQIKKNYLLCEDTTIIKKGIMLGK